MAVKVKLCLVVLLLAAAVAPNLGSYVEHGTGWSRAYGGVDTAYFDAGGIIDDDNVIRRGLFQYGYGYPYPRNRYLSYDAINKNNIPCGHHGSSYYDCTKRRRANPYRRGCTAITGCARFTD